MTNYEMIKQMTLEQLADFLEGFNQCLEDIDSFNNGCCECIYTELCHGDITIMDWLAREEEVKP